MSTTRIPDKAEGPATRGEDAPPGSGRRRAGVTAAAGGAAVAALVAAGAVFTVMATDDGRSAPVSAPTADENVAQDFLSAYTTFDPQNVALHLADEATMPREWWRDLKRYEAMGVVFLVEPCEVVSGSSAGENMSCPFDFHALGTGELGRTPFGENDFALRVDDGKVESFQATYNTAINGFDRYYDAVGSWIRVNHPGDWAFMDSYENVSSAELPRWLSLWETRLGQYENRLADYAEATNGG